MTAAVSRAEFLRGRFSADTSALRPPWALNETDFTARCTRYMSCVDACPENIIFKGQGGFPEISFADGECTFCAACVKTCPVGALSPTQDERNRNTKPWNLHLSVSDNCLSTKDVVCRICPDKCDARAIRFKHPAANGKPAIDQDLCTGCGACVAPCPVGALTLSPVHQHKAA